jgi:hypothetical protein
MPFFKIIHLLFIHIPKTGGTSVENYLYNKYNIKKSFHTLYSDISLTLNNHSLQHSTYLEILEKQDYFDLDLTNVKIISIVRNPYHRIISDLFFFKLINQNSTKEEIYEKIKYFLNSNDLLYDNHKMEQYKYLINSENIIEPKITIMKTETLTENIRSFRPFDNFNLHNNVTFKDKINYMSLLNMDSIQLINEFYKKDFEYFNYPIQTHF